MVPIIALGNAGTVGIIQSKSRAYGPFRALVAGSRFRFVADQTVSAVRTRGSQEAGCRSRGVEFAPDSPLEEAVSSEPVSEAEIPC
jgi:hypothetical protein